MSKQEKVNKIQVEILISKYGQHDLIIELLSRLSVQERKWYEQIVYDEFMKPTFDESSIPFDAIKKVMEFNHHGNR